MPALLQVLREARACDVCADRLPMGPRPLIAATAASRMMIIGQAPGRAAHESGIPWHDRSGERLRDWLGITPATFYNAAKVGLMPMGFCYPGAGKSGDLAPRPECAPLWHDKILFGLKQLKLTIYVGQYAFDRYLGSAYPALTQAVLDFDTLLPTRVVLPHPSPRNNIWLRKNPWFETQLLPELRRRVKEIMA